MNIVQITTSLAPEFGGTARTVPALSVELAALGNRVDLVYLDFGGTYTKPILPQHSNLQYHPLQVTLNAGMRPIWIPGFRSRLYDLGRERNELIFHDNGVWLPYSGQLLDAARTLGAKVITTTHGMLEPWALEYRSLRKKLAWILFQKRRLNRNSALLATSSAEALNLRRLQLTPPITVIANGTEIPELPIQGRQHISGIKTMLFLSRIHPKKGLLNLVEAVNHLKPAGWRIQIAGYDEGGYQAVVENAVRENDLEEYFSFLGPIKDDEKWELYSRADVFILPSFSENFGLVIAEALAAGTPVITTRGTPWQDLLDYNCGWWIEPTLHDLTLCLQSVFTLDLKVLREMGARGRELVLEKYSWPAVARQLNEVYGWMLGIREGQPPTVMV
jgi:glycosyltransferase involved in cell wall biosynthesis